MRVGSHEIDKQFSPNFKKGGNLCHNINRCLRALESWNDSTKSNLLCVSCIDCRLIRLVVFEVIQVQSSKLMK